MKAITALFQELALVYVDARYGLAFDKYLELPPNTHL